MSGQLLRELSTGQRGEERLGDWETRRLGEGRRGEEISNVEC